MVALIERLRRSNPLPEGAVPVAVGLIVTGVATYLLFAVTSRVLDANDYSALAVLWTLLFAVGNGVMQPLEQEVARAVSDRRARGQGSAPVIRRAAVVGLGFTGVLAVGALVAREWMVEELFGGSEAMVVALVLGLLGFCAGHLVRGTLSSHGRFRSYGGFFAVDGITRPVAAGMLALAGVAAVGAYGLVVAIAPFVGVAAALRGQRGLLQPGPEASWGEAHGQPGMAPARHDLHSVAAERRGDRGRAARWGRAVGGGRGLPERPRDREGPALPLPGGGRGAVAEALPPTRCR